MHVYIHNTWSSMGRVERCGSINGDIYFFISKADEDESQTWTKSDDLFWDVYLEYKQNA